MLMRQVAVYTVRGHVYNMITQKPGMGAFILLMPSGDNGDFESGYQRRVDKPDGTFTIPDVVPGSYSFAAAWIEDGKFYATNFPVEVGNADVEGVSVTITPGVTIGGQIVWEGKPNLEKDDLYVSARLLDDQLSFGNRIRINQTNTFALRDMGEGIYHLDLDGLGKDCYVKDIQFGQTSVIDDGFTVARSNNGRSRLWLARAAGVFREAWSIRTACRPRAFSLYLYPRIKRCDRNGGCTNIRTPISTDDSICGELRPATIYC